MHILKFFETDDAGKTLENNTIMVTKVEEQDGPDNYNSLKDKGDVKIGETPNGNSILNKSNELESSIKDKTPDGNKDDDEKKVEDGDDPNQSKSSCKLRFKIKTFR